MLSLPVWRAHEYALSIMYYLRERSEEKLIVETRRPDHEIMKALSVGNPLDFYRTEIAERKRYGYPPFSVFIGLTTTGTKAVVDKFCSMIKETFKNYDVVGPLPPILESKNDWSAKAVLRLPKESWPDETLRELLSTLAPEVKIEIDPDEIV